MARAAIKAVVSPIVPNGFSGMTKVGCSGSGSPVG